MSWRSLDAVLDHDGEPLIRIWDRKILEERLKSERWTRQGEVSSRTHRVRHMAANGYTFAEIAREMGITADRVSKIVHRRR